MRTIFQINLTCGKGSTGKIVVDIHDEAIKNGYDSYIAYVCRDSELGKSFKFETKLQNFIRRILNKFFGVKDWHMSLATISLIRKIKTIKPDVIHLHNIHQGTMNLKALFRFFVKYNKPIVYTLHDCWAFTGGCYHFTEINCEKYKNTCFDCPLPKAYLDQKSKKNISSYFNAKKKNFTSVKNMHIVAVSNWLNSVASESFLNKYPIVTIHNGIDIEIFKPSEENVFSASEQLKGKFIVLGVADVWGKRKRLIDFIELSKHIDESCHIVLIGKILEQDKKILPGNITSFERIDSKNELAKFYSSADVLINFSLEETFGMIVAEAMSCGTPVIVYNSTANPEILAEHCGYVLEKGDINGALDCLFIIKENGKQFYRTACRDHIAANYPVSKMKEEYIRLYNKLIDENEGV